MQTQSLNLPANIAHWLQQALDLLPDGDQAQVTQNPKTDGAFNHIVFVHTPSDRYVFRARRQMSLDETTEYMRAMYEFTGFLALGGDFRIRTTAAEISFMKQALEAGLPVPQLIHYGHDWMLIEYIQGQTLWSLLEQGQVKPLMKVLRSLHQANRQDIIYADRWGGNELIDPQGNVRLIDFDIEWIEGRNDLDTLKALEVAWSLFNAMRLACDRPAVLQLVKTEAVPNLREWGYNLPQIKHFVEGLTNFYLNPNKPCNQWSLPPNLYISMADPAAQLAQLLVAC